MVLLKLIGFHFIRLVINLNMNVFFIMKIYVRLKFLHVLRIINRIVEPTIYSRPLITRAIHPQSLLQCLQLFDKKIFQHPQAHLFRV